MSDRPEISVVVASHDRPVRLRWLLNALQEQTLAPERWEVVVGHDSAGAQTDELLERHPLAAVGVLRHVRASPGSAPPGANRNAALRLARAELVAFTDDDCRPPADWLANALAAARRHPGAIVQGATREDPEELLAMRTMLGRSQCIDPPTPWAEACNIVYPRELLDLAGGFCEDVMTGEDTDLAERCRALGARLVAAPEVLTHHACSEAGVWATLRGLMRWQDLPLLIRRHPQLRREFPLGLFWKRSHLRLVVFFAGVKLSRRSWLLAVLCLPWLVQAAPERGSTPRARLRSASELPLRMALDLAEMLALARGSVRHRTLFV